MKNTKKTMDINGVKYVLVKNCDCSLCQLAKNGICPIKESSTCEIKSGDKETGEGRRFGHWVRAKTTGTL